MIALRIPVIVPDSDTLTAAVAYARAGWYVLPTRRGSKHPGSVVGDRWQQQSSRDPEQLVAWLAGTNHGLALHVGRSGALAFDVDDPPRIPELLTAAIERDQPPFQSTRTNVDHKGHYLYRAPVGRHLGNSTGKLGHGWGEVRGRNGVIIVSPSRHEKATEGGRYNWLRTGDVPVLPDDLAALLPDTSEVVDAATDAEVSAFCAEHTSQRAPGLLLAVLHGFQRELADGGSRHDAMVTATCWAAREARAGAYSARQAFTRLQAAFVEALRAPRAGSSRTATASLAADEFAGITAWACAQADAADLGKIRRGIEQRIPDYDVPPPDEPPDDGWAGADREETPNVGDNAGGDTGKRAPALQFLTFADLAARVDAAGPRKWLLRGIWPAGDYGVHAAEPKAQKSWNAVDLAVSVASGEPWLGAIPVDAPGPVLMFVGEGGEANTVRRVRAVAEARKVTAETLPIVVCTRAPYLSDRRHITLMADQITAMRPALVVLDPLYLSARGANLSDLFGMGELLETPQRICQAAGASLFVVHHHNRKEGRGASRMTGAGAAEWGRVLISSTVKSRRTDPETGATDVVTELDVIGGEVPDQTLRLHRRIWSDDPADLDSPLHLTTTVTIADTDAEEGPTPREVKLSPAAQKLLGVLRDEGVAMTSKQLVDGIVERYGHGLKRQTVSSELNKLAAAGLVEGMDQGAFAEKVWRLVDQAESENPRSRRVSTCQHEDDHSDQQENPRSHASASVADASDLTRQRVSAPYKGRADTADTSDGDSADTAPTDDLVAARLTHQPQPVGDIAEQVGADPFAVEACLETLTAEGRAVTREPGHGPRTWVLPERDLDQWPDIPKNGRTP